MLDGDGHGADPDGLLANAGTGYALARLGSTARDERGPSGNHTLAASNASARARHRRLADRSSHNRCAAHGQTLAHLLERPAAVARGHGRALR